MHLPYAMCSVRYWNCFPSEAEVICSLVNKRVVIYWLWMVVWYIASAPNAWVSDKWGPPFLQMTWAIISRFFHSLNIWCFKLLEHSLSLLSSHIYKECLLRTWQWGSGRYTNVHPMSPAMNVSSIMLEIADAGQSQAHIWRIWIANVIFWSVYDLTILFPLQWISIRWSKKLVLGSNWWRKLSM